MGIQGSNRFIAPRRLVVQVKIGHLEAELEAESKEYDALLATVSESQVRSPAASLRF